MANQLTRRQKQFLEQFLDFYQKMGKPIHYTALAEHLGLGKITAYEMLRLLEKQELVKAEYHLSPNHNRPGRSEVFFLPTEKAQRLVAIKVDESQNSEKWEIIKSRIFKQLSEVKSGKYETLMDDLLARISTRRSPMAFMAEMITVFMLALSAVKDTPSGKQIITRLEEIGFPGEIELITLAGVSLALSIILNVNIRFISFFMKQSSRYQEMLLELSPQKEKQLASFTEKVAKIVMG